MKRKPSTVESDVKQPDRLISRPSRAFALFTAGAIMVGACSNPADKPSRQAIQIEQGTKDSIDKPHKLNILPGYLIAPSGIKTRLTPARINTLNNALITGNEGPSEPIALTRPIIVEQPNPEHGGDPHYWAGGYSETTGDFLWVGISDETTKNFKYYTVPRHPHASFCEGKLEGLYPGEVKTNSSGDGLIIDPDDADVPVASAITSPHDIKNLETHIRNQGYEVTPLCK